ncbi:MAG: hypothetical protein LUD76_05055 [Alistipes sp.]|nr:hypothetical protein [Alistipes sp.]
MSKYLINLTLLLLCATPSGAQPDYGTGIVAEVNGTLLWCRQLVMVDGRTAVYHDGEGRLRKFTVTTEYPDSHSFHAGYFDAEGRLAHILFCDYVPEGLSYAGTATLKDPGIGEVAVDIISMDVSSSVHAPNRSRGIIYGFPQACGPQGHDHFPQAGTIAGQLGNAVFGEPPSGPVIFGEPSPGDTVYVNTNNVPLRQHSSDDAQTVALLRAGDKLVVTSVNPGNTSAGSARWLGVRSYNRTGYVRGEFTEPVAIPAGLPPPSPH